MEKGVPCLSMLVKHLLASLCLVVQDSSRGDGEREYTDEQEDTGFTLMFLVCEVSRLFIRGFVFPDIKSPMLFSQKVLKCLRNHYR